MSRARSAGTAAILDFAALTTCTLIDELGIGSYFWLFAFADGFIEDNGIGHCPSSAAESDRWITPPCLSDNRLAGDTIGFD